MNLVTIDTDELAKLVTKAVRDALVDFQPSRNDDEKLLDVKEAAAFLRLKVQTVYQLTSGRKLPFMKLSKKLYFKQSALLLYLEGGRKSTLKEAGAEALKNLKK